jgi:hypothetical protein
LVAFDRPDRALDTAALEARFRRPDFSAGFERVGIRNFPALLAHEQIPLGTLQAADLTGELHTLLHPILSHRAARAFFRGNAAAIPRYVTPRSAHIGAQNSLLRRATERDGQIPEETIERVAREACRIGFAIDCATVFAAWKHDYPDSPRFSDALAWARGLSKQGDPWSVNKSGVETMLTEARLASLVRLFGGGRAITARAPAQAKKLTMDYVRHFNYAFPFDRGVLEAAWRRCTAPPCAAAVRRAEEKLGPLARKVRPRPAALPTRGAD